MILFDFSLWEDVLHYAKIVVGACCGWIWVFGIFASILLILYLKKKGKVRQENEIKISK